MIKYIYDDTRIQSGKTKGYEKMPDIIKKNLQTGINLYYIPDKKYKTVSVSLFLHRNLSKDEATANALLAKVLGRGTAKYTDINALNCRAEELYGTFYDVNITKKAYAQSIVCTVNFLSDSYVKESLFPAVSELMLDLVFDPYITDGGFDKSYIASEKRNLKDDIEGLINDKRSYADFRCIEEMCANEANSIFEFGYLDKIDLITPEDLYSHYKSIITTSPIDIYIVGDVDIDSAEKLFAEYLSRFDFNCRELGSDMDIIRSAGEVKYVSDELDVIQGKLVMGFRAALSIDDSDYYALLVGNSIFGAGAHSRLFNTVREKMSLCYYASSRLDKFRGIILVSSGIEFENYEKSKDEILRQLKNVSGGDFTDEELEVSREFIVNNYRSYKDSPYMMKDYYRGHEFSENRDTIDEAIEKIKNVHREDVVRAMANIALDTVYFLKGKEQDKA